jgi:hypothetical protein
MLKSRPARAVGRKDLYSNGSNLSNERTKLLKLQALVIQGAVDGELVAPAVIRELTSVHN